MVTKVKPAKPNLFRFAPLIGSGLISLKTEFEPFSSSNGWDIEFWKSNMAAIVTFAKPNLLSLVWWDYLCQEGHLDTLNIKICPLVMISSIVVDWYGHLDTLNVKIRPLFQILLTEQDVARSLVPILATRELVAPLANNPIMLGRLIR